MAAQVIQNRIDLLHAGRDPRLDALQELYPIGDRPPVVRCGQRLSSGRTERAEDIAVTPATVVDLLRGARCRLELGSQAVVDLQQLPTRITPRRERSHLIQADDHTTVRRGRVKPADDPLFSANSGSSD